MLLIAKAIALGQLRHDRQNNSNKITRAGLTKENKEKRRKNNENKIQNAMTVN